MAKTKRMTNDEFEKVVSGGEPVFDVRSTFLSKFDIIKALNWYSANRDFKDSRKYIVEYFRKNKLKLDEPNLNSVVNTVGWLCRMVTRGAKLDQREKEYLDRNIRFLTEQKKSIKVKKEIAVASVSVRDRVQEKANECMGEIEGAIDDFILSKYKEERSPFAIMNERGIKGMHGNMIVDVFKKQRDHWQEVLNSKDEQIREGYSNFKKADIKKLIAYCQRVVDDAQGIVGESKKTRKPRKRKAKTAEQLTSKLKYCSENKELNIKSIDPKTIVGAESVWVYNCKTRKLGCYIADDASGITVKGSTIQNFSEVKSIMKTVRKPSDVVPNVVSGGKVFLRNVIQNIRAKETKLNGRFNKDTLILRVIK